MLIQKCAEEIIQGNFERSSPAQKNTRNTRSQQIAGKNDDEIQKTKNAKNKAGIKQVCKIDRNN